MIDWPTFAEYLNRSRGQGYFGWAAVEVACLDCEGIFFEVVPLYTEAVIECPYCDNIIETFIKIEYTHGHGEGPPLVVNGAT